MWHEARKQEKKIKGILVDYKRRAERRKEYYERIKLDPTQFIQLHGRSCKVHLDPSVYYAAEAPGSMLPWRGDPNILIDRFDVRAHLDSVPPLESTASPQLARDERKEMRRINYERYRILVQNDFMGIKEERFLNQIHLEELYGPIVKPDEERKPTGKRAAIGFIYDENVDINTVPLPPEPPPDVNDIADSDEDSDEEIDLDLTVDVMALGAEHQAELNNCGLDYALGEHDFMSMIKRDLREAEAIRLAKEQEDEKAMYSGRKSRKERRLIKKKHLGRKGSPRRYASRTSPTVESLCSSPNSHSSSRSPSPSKSANSTQNTPERQAKFITSIGDDSEGLSEPEHGVIIMPKTSSNSKLSPSKPLGSSSSSSSKAVKKKYWDRRSGSPMRSSNTRRRVSSGSSGGRSRSRSKTRSISRRRYSRSYSRNKRRRTPRRSRSRRSRSWSRYSRSRSRTRSRDRSYSYSRYHSRTRSRSRVQRNFRAKDSRISKSKQNSSSASQGSKSIRNSPKSSSPPKSRYYGRRGKSDSDKNSDWDSDGDQKDSESSNINKGTVAGLGTSSFGTESSSTKVSKNPFVQIKLRALESLNDIICFHVQKLPIDLIQFIH